MRGYNEYTLLEMGRIIELNKKKVFAFIPAVVFLGFIFVMGFLFVFLPKRNYSENEKRYLEDFPKVTAENIFLGDFDKEFETYMADHVAGRDFFVGMNAYYDLCSGRNGSNGVYACKDDYLINDPVEKENKLEGNLKIFSEFDMENKLNTNLMIIPSTGFVMKDKLPANHKNYLDEEYFKIIKNNSGRMNFINVMNPFKISANRGNQLYYRTDHHWTTRGAYLAYKLYCKNIGLAPIPEENFSKNIIAGFYGTTYSTSALWNTPPDSIELWENHANRAAVDVKITDSDGSKENGSYFFVNHLAEKDKYPTFLDGNHALVEIKNKNANGGKLLLIKDSFAHAIVPFLSENYSEIVMVDLRYYKKPVSKLINEKGISDLLVLYSIDNFATDTDIAFLS